MVMRYREIAEDLNRRIEAGDFTDQLPGWRELVKEYKTSLRTMQRVMDILRLDDIVTTRAGQGTYVNKKRVN
jgi:DNA-binding GntR family transcriptional regulator